MRFECATVYLVQAIVQRSFDLAEVSGEVQSPFPFAGVVLEAVYFLSQFENERVD